MEKLLHNLEVDHMGNEVCEQICDSDMPIRRNKQLVLPNSKFIPWAINHLSWKSFSLKNFSIKSFWRSERMAICSVEHTLAECLSDFPDDRNLSGESANSTDVWPNLLIRISRRESQEQPPGIFMIRLIRETKP